MSLTGCLATLDGDAGGRGGRLQTPCGPSHTAEVWPCAAPGVAGNLNTDTLLLVQTPSSGELRHPVKMTLKLPWGGGGGVPMAGSHGSVFSIGNHQDVASPAPDQDDKL